jgi:hypothetical protein
MGYVGFSVAFAFAIAALMGGRLDAAWARWSRPWTNVAWAFLSLGIMLGSWWAYYELGWGGWWFWDPVENASFMPWLAGTALLHSLAVTEKRGLFKSWTVLLAIFTFSEPARYLPGAQRRADLGARVCHRSGARPVHPGVPRHRRRRIADPLRSASADGTQPYRLRSRVPGIAAAGQQRRVPGCHADGAVRHPLSASHGCAGPGQVLRGTAVFQCRFCAPDGAADAFHGDRPPVALAR